MAQDWVADLREFGADTVAEACGEWRRSQSRRPTIAEIRALAIRAQAERRSGDEPLALPSPEDRQRRAEFTKRRDETMQQAGRRLADEWAQRRGHSTIDAYAEATGVHWSEAYRRVIAENLAGSPIGTALSGSAASLGVRAKEFKPSPEQLAEGRRALGLEDME